MKHNASDYDFLPGVEGIVNHSPRWMMYAIPSFIFTLLIGLITWSIYSDIDVIAASPGTIVPTGRVKLIQPKNTSVIGDIYISEGKIVKKGEALVQLSNSENNKTIATLKLDIKLHKLQRARLTSISLWPENSFVSFLVPNGILESEAENERLLLNTQWKSYQAQLNEFLYRINNARQSRSTIKAELVQLEQEFVFAKKSTKRYKLFLESKSGTLEKYEQALEKQTSTKNQIEIKKSQLKEAISQIEVIKTEKQSFRFEFYLTNNTELKKISDNLKKIQLELDNELIDKEHNVLRAPIDGVVTDLKVFTKGGVVQSGEVLMKIVPSNQMLEVDTKILNRDIGFVHIGQQVKVKIDAFNFTKYGSLVGTITKISNDAVLDEQLGPVYHVLVSLESNKIKVNGNWVKLIAGMTANIDVYTGKRKLFEYIMNPFLRYKDEALRER